MPVVDVDSHFFEPMDWLEVTDPDLAAELAPPHRFMDFMRAGAELVLPILPEDERPEDAADLLPQSFRHLMERMDALQPDRFDPASDDPAYLGKARVAALDAAGIDVQLINFTFASGGVLRANQAGRPDLVPRVQAAYNTFAANMVAGFTDRLVPVCRMHLEDLEWSIAELTRMRELGSRAFWATQHPTKSLSHRDFDPLWSAAEDLGMLAYVHVFFGRPGPHPSWANNGRGARAFQEGIAAGDQRVETRNFLNAMVFDGVLERHPRLTIVVAECGYSWVAPMAHEFDYRVKGIGVDGQREESFYSLPLKPSEYLARQVRVSPLAGFVETGFEDLSLREACDRFPSPEMLVFSTDYPHLEGRYDARSVFDQHLPDDDKIRSAFYGGTMSTVLGL